MNQEPQVFEEEFVAKIPRSYKAQTFVNRRSDIYYFCLPVMISIPLGVSRANYLDIYQEPEQLVLKKLKFNNVNLQHQHKKEFYCGPSIIYSQQIPHNVIFGVDYFELYSVFDDYDLDVFFNPALPEDMQGPPIQGKFESVEEKIVKNADTMSITGGKILELDELLENSLSLLSKYGVRDGEFIDYYGLMNDVQNAQFMAMTISVPAKRDRTSTIFRFYTGSTEEEIRIQIVEHLAKTSVNNTRYEKTYVSIQPVEANSRIMVGVFTLYPYLIMYDYDAAQYLTGSRDHNEGAGLESEKITRVEDQNNE